MTRVILFILLLVIPPLGAAVIVAYDGIDRAPVGWMAAFLIIREIGTGDALGVVSLAFVAMLLVAYLIGRMMSIVPLVREPGWSMTALIRSALLCTLLALTMMLGSVLVRAEVYHVASLGQLARFTFSPFLWVVVVYFCGSLLGLATLHRGDVPFRRKIEFGR